MYRLLYKPSCPYCMKVIRYLDENGLDHELIDSTNIPMTELRRLPDLKNKKRITVPQIWFNEEYIGDSVQFFKHLRS